MFTLTEDPTPDTPDTHARAVRAALLLSMPRIGAPWPEHGGHFAGIVAGDDGAPDHILIIGPEADSELTFDAANDWAHRLNHAGHSDWTLPSRREQAVAYGNCKSLFETDYYWSHEQYAGTEGYAWCQDFSYGFQYSGRKYGALRARAVRRLPI